jgi:hypothetical protein
MSNIFFLNAPLEVALDEFDFPPRTLNCDFACGTEVTTWQRIRAWKHHYSIARPHLFKQQVADCDLLILNGGDTPTLIDTLLHDCGDWGSELDGKVVVAYSAGISALAQFSYNRDHHTILRGMSVIPYQTIVHFNVHSHRDWGLVEILEKSHPDIPVKAIPDNGYYRLEA